MKIIDGKKLAEKINDYTASEVFRLGHRPNIAVILVGNNPDSELYVKKKLETGKKVGVDTHLYRCEPELGQAKLLEMVDFLNKDEMIDAILIQLPLPKDQGYDTDEVVGRIDPAKDVDCFHPENVKRLTTVKDDSQILPPVYGAIFEMIKSLNCEVSGKRVAVVSKSEIFGGNLAKIFSLRGAEAEKIHPDDPDLAKKTITADILVPVIGRPKFIKKEMIKDGAIVIDVGITHDEGFTYGDVDFDSVKDMDGYVSPVPGGVGPMTVAMTLKNTLELYKRRMKNK